MSNTWNATTFDNIAQMGISTLEKKLVPMAGFSTNLSTDLPQGDTVKTRIVPAATAATDLTDDESGSYAAVVDDQTTTAVSVQLDPHPVTGFALTDAEAQEIGAGVWSDTAKRLVKTHARAIADEVLDDLFALVTESNYGAAAVTTAAGNFSSDDVADLRTTCVKAGLDPTDMVLVLNADYYGALIKDNAIADFSASQADALRSGKLPTLSGFTVMEAPTLPGNSENLVGFAAQADAMAIAMRGVDTQDRGQFLSYEILQDATVGSVMTYSALWTPTYRQVEHVFEALFGVKKANGSALKRIISE